MAKCSRNCFATHNALALIALLLPVLYLVASQPASSGQVTVRNARELFHALAEAGAANASANAAPVVIQLAGDILLTSADVPETAVQLQRDVTIRGRGADPAASSAPPAPTAGQENASLQPGPPGIALPVTQLDFAFIHARVRLAPGVVLSLEGLELTRALTRISAHLDFMARSDGATVRLEGCVQHRVACAPFLMAEANFRSLPRPTGQAGAPNATGQGAPPDQQPQQQSHPRQDVSLVTAYPLCWSIAGVASGGGAAGDGDQGWNEERGEQQAASRSNQTLVPVPTLVRPPPGLAAPPGGDPAVRCQAPFLDIRSVSYTTQVLDSELADNGGYTIIYVRSAMVCDWPVSNDCVATRGTDRCVADETAFRTANLAAADGSNELQAGYGVPADRGRRRRTGLALGLGLGLGLGGALAFVAAIIAASLQRLRRQQQREAGDQGVRESTGSSGLKLRVRNSSASSGTVPAGTASSGGGSGSDGEDQRGNPPIGWRQRDESQGQGLAGLEPAGADPPYPALDYEHGPRPVVGVAAAPSLESSSAPRQPRRRRPSPAAGDAPHGINAPRVRSQPLPRVSGVQVAVTAAGAELLDAGPSSLPSGSLLSGDAFRSGEPDQVEALRRTLLAGRARHQQPAVHILEPIGQGSFARVYKGIWQGTVVAVKVMLLPASLTRSEQQHHMAVMEAAISSAMSHPNIVQTYSYSFRPVLDSTRTQSAGSDVIQYISAGSATGLGEAAPGAASRLPSGTGIGIALAAGGVELRPHGYELQLVLEYCDLGTLRGALDAGAFHRDGIARGAGVASAAGPRLPPIPDQDHDQEHHHHHHHDQRQGQQQGAPTAGDSIWSNFTMTAGAAGTLATLLGWKEKQGQQQQQHQEQERETEQRHKGQGPSVLQAPEAAAAAEAAARGGPAAAELHGGTSLPVGPHPEATGGTSHQATPLVKLSQQVNQPSTPSLSTSAPARDAPTQQHHHQEQPGLAGTPPPLPLLQAPAYRYSLMLDIACDVASAMLHLHNHNIVHGDVKASNVLLKSGGGLGRSASALSPQPPTTATPTAMSSLMRPSSPPGRRGTSAPGAPARAGSPLGPSSAGVLSTAVSVPPGAGLRCSLDLLCMGVVAKVSDFGLSTHVDESMATHISALTAQGTLSHMSPELLLHGHISKKADVFAFGVMLWELFTGDRAHKGVLRALLPHKVALGGLRPVFPLHTPPDYRALAERCWLAEPHARPTFEAIVAELQRMRTAAALAQAQAQAQAQAARQRAAAAAGGALSSIATTSLGAATAATGSTGGVLYGTAGTGSGWVEMPRLDATTCDSLLYAELAGSTVDASQAQT